jgi:molecular chaperone GrpE (heat shock protein)
MLRSALAAALQWDKEQCSTLQPEANQANQIKCLMFAAIGFQNFENRLQAKHRVAHSTAFMAATTAHCILNTADVLQSTLLAVRQSIF